jgi:acetolactate synthase-1/2/3 large subunit
VKLSGGEIVRLALEAEEIRYTFGIPGTHNIELYDALAGSDRIRPVLVTDEQSAGFMADGLWRASGSMGCVNIVPGAGLTHALSGIAEAYLDGVPMLVLGCGIRRDARYAFQLHDIDQLAIARPVTKGVYRPETGMEVYAAIRDACRLARSGTPGPVMVEVSVDLYLTRHEVDPATWHPAEELDPPAPRPEDLREAAARLGAPGARPLIYAGLGARLASAELIELAERLDAPVATTIQGKGVFPESHPLFLWNGLGATTPPFVRRAAESCNLMLAVGCRFSEVGTGSWGFAAPGPLIHVDINPDALNRNLKAQLAIVSDAKLFLAGLLRQLPSGGPPARSSARDAIARGHEAVGRARLDAASERRVTPAVLLEAVQRIFGPSTIFVTDSGNGTFLAMETLRLERPGCFLAPVDYSCMGYAVPAALGARLGCPGTPVVALAGDGALLMTGLELLTAAHLGLAVAVIVLRDRELAQIAQFQSTAFGRRVASELPDYHVGSLAEATGVEWLSLDRDAEVESVIGAAFATVQAGRPVVVDTAIDYAEKTWFTKGVVKTMLLRLSWPDRIRFVARAMRRKLSADS